MNRVGRGPGAGWRWTGQNGVAETKSQTVNWCQGPMNNAKGNTRTHKAPRSRGSFIPASKTSERYENTAP